MTQRESSNQWLTPPQKIPRVKSAGKFLALIFWDQDYVPKGQNNLCRVLLISADAIEGNFEG
jgi:hypothetical protein